MATSRDVHVVVQRMVQHSDVQGPLSHAYTQKIIAKHAMYEAIDILTRINGNIEKSISQIQDGLLSLKYGVDMFQIQPELKEAAMDPRLRIHFADCSELSRQCTEARRRAGLP